MSNSNKLPAMTKPCSNCPFRKDSTKGWLGKKRISEILISESFTCHKTTDNKLGRKQCAGFMLIQNGNSAFEVLAEFTGQKLELSGRELIFETFDDCIKHHS